MNLVEQYHAVLDAHINEDGVAVPPALLLGPSGTLTMLALAVEATEAYSIILLEIAKGATEAIFALDRFTKPGQGTSLADVMAGHYYANGIFTPFIVEYQHEPRIVKDLAWDNEFWNRALRGELTAVQRQTFGFTIHPDDDEA